ncbi:Heat-labile enterotoxin, A chain [Ophiocordyceps camponoti-floridani]|uniref:Heat-labile enterotoxin, A chain n=1 Tax=Ophiocordyceps camponoti-floridani TaxID=2030778 RepID=A0A8H4QER1_9HYPO|nr:Heat-labile enterotoxin, A chain [Ophiocordyceps camponoti-floridani]
MHVKRATISALLYLEWPAVINAGNCLSGFCGPRSETPLEGPSVWRVDGKPPDVIQKLGGFRAKGTDFSIHKHAEISTANSAYVSTSERPVGAEIFASEPPPPGDFRRKNYKGSWLYDIHPSSNFISTRKTLGPYSSHRAEAEILAAGGIPFDQIKGWTYLSKGRMTAKSERRYVRNSAYDKAKYQGQTWNPEPQYELAGFPKKMDKANPRIPREHPWTHKEYEAFKDQSAEELREAGLRYLNDEGKASGIASFEPCFGLNGRAKREASSCWLGEEEVVEPEVYTKELDLGGKTEGESEVVLLNPAEEEKAALLVEKAAEDELAAVASKLLLRESPKLKDISLKEVRARFIGYKPLQPYMKTSRGRLWRGLTSAFTAVGLASWLKDVVQVSATASKRIDKLTTVTSIFPLVGCGTAVARSKDAFSGTLCLVGDVLLFTPKWPVGVAVHLFRFLAEAAKQSLRENMLWHDEAEFQKIRQKEWDAVFDNLVGYFRSNKFRNEVLEPEFDAERHGYAVQATDSVGMLRAMQQTAREKDVKGVPTDEQVFNATLHIYQHMCSSLLKRKESIMKEKQQAAEEFVKAEMKRFDLEFGNRTLDIFVNRTRPLLPTFVLDKQDLKYSQGGLTRTSKEEDHVPKDELVSTIRERLKKPLSYDMQGTFRDIQRHSSHLTYCRVQDAQSGGADMNQGRNASLLIQYQRDTDPIDHIAEAPPGRELAPQNGTPRRQPAAPNPETPRARTGGRQRQRVPVGRRRGGL